MLPRKFAYALLICVPTVAVSQARPKSLTAADSVRQLAPLPPAKTASRSSQSDGNFPDMPSNHWAFEAVDQKSVPLNAQQLAGIKIFVSKLGRARSMFGQPSVAGTPDPVWSPSAPNHAADLFFPAGSSNRRFLFSIDERAKPFKGTLAYEVLTSQGIKKDWYVEVAAAPKAGRAKPGKAMGGLTAYLAQEGLRVVPPISGEVRSLLDASISYAVYTASAGAKRTMSSAFLSSDGQFVGNDENGYFVDVTNFPNTGFAYPITPEEVDLITQNWNRKPTKK